MVTRRIRRAIRVLGLLFVLSAVWPLPNAAHALIEVSDGNRPIENRGWPRGAEAVANLPSRLGYMVGPPFGGGEYYFVYSCKGTAEFNRALQKFGAIRVPRMARRSLISLDGQRTWIMDDKPLLLVVHDWAKEPWCKMHGREAANDSKGVDWTFTIWVPESFHSLFSNPKRSFDSDHPNFHQPVPPPRIDVHLGGDSLIVWERAEVPSNVRVIETRAKAVPVSVDAGGVIRGGVFDMATHQVVVGADVVLSQRTQPRQWRQACRTKTDQDGFFELRAIPRGYYEIHICADGYADRNVGIFHNRNGHAYREFDALLMKTVSREGIVQDNQGNPIPGVTVYARNTLGIDGLGYKCSVDPCATTDENGRFELHLLPAGFTGIRCRAPALHQQTSTFNVYEVPTEPWRKPDPIKIIMSGTGVVRGKVIGTDRRPPTRAFMAEIQPKDGLRVGTWGGSMQCKKDGSFEFKGVPPGEYIIVAKPNPMREGEASEPKLVTITVGGIVDLEIVNDYAHNTKVR